MEFEGGGVVLKFHFKIRFLQSCFLNDQYSSSFHVIGKQVFSNQCPRLVKKCYFTIPFEGLDHYPRVSQQKKVEFDRLVLSPPALPLYRGRDDSIMESHNPIFWSGLGNFCDLTL